MKGKIVKGVGGFYYVNSYDSGDVIECRAGGIFRKDGLKPTVGDEVEFIVKQNSSLGYIEVVHPRKNLALRPYVSNVDQAVIVASVMEPEFNNWLVDRLILMFRYFDIDPVVAVSKCDLDEKTAERISEDYNSAGVKSVYFNSVIADSAEGLFKILKDKVSLLAGVSGSGKSTLVNRLTGYNVQTGNISDKNKRGKHTTRHSELFKIDGETSIIDTPGFSSLDLKFLDKTANISDYYFEFFEYGKSCKFDTCEHINEPGCNVKNAVEKHLIPSFRYENYVSFVNEFKKIRRY